MRITKRQLRKIIREAVSRRLKENTLYVSKSEWNGSPIIEDDNDNWITVGEMIRSLLEAGDDDIFYAPQGVDPKSLQSLLTQDKENVQGPIEKWDNDVFTHYYNVDIERVINLYARLKSYTIKDLSQEDEYEDDGTNEFEEMYS